MFDWCKYVFVVSVSVSYDIMNGYHEWESGWGGGGGMFPGRVVAMPPAAGTGVAQCLCSIASPVMRDTKIH